MNRSYGSSSPQNSYTSIYPRKPRMSSVVNPQANPSNNIFFKKPDVLLQQRANADLITNNQLSPNHNLPRIRKNESRLNISKSPSPQNSYDGSFVRRHSRDQSPEMRGRSGRLKSLAFRKEMESEIAIPERISRIVVGIYSHTGIDNEPTAMGILIGTRLILTSHIAVPNETLATKYTFKFVNDDCVYKSNIKKFFFTSANENLTLLSINPVDQDLSKRKPVLLEANLKETEAERLCYISPKAYSAFVSSTELDNFGFTTLKPVLSGAPVFNYEWKFLGISHTYTKLYKFTQAASIDSIFKFLNRLKQQIPRDSALGSLIDSLDLSGKEHDHLENSYLYWFEWLGNYVESYNAQTGEWGYSKVEMTNEARFAFLWDSRPVMLPTGSHFIIGGIKNNLAVDEVIKFHPGKKSLKRMPSMGISRAACAVVCHDNYVYALSGRYASNFCERYHLIEKRWEFITSMTTERYDFSAIVIYNSIYAVGGEMIGQIGNSIEVYDILREIWTQLQIKLPYPVANPPLCHLFGSSFAILGGRSCKHAMIVEIDPRSGKSVAVREGALLAEEVETIYPVIYAPKQQKVFLFNISKGLERPLLYKIHESYLTK